MCLPGQVFSRSCVYTQLTLDSYYENDGTADPPYGQTDRYCESSISLAKLYHGDGSVYWNMGYPFNSNYCEATNGDIHVYFASISSTSPTLVCKDVTTDSDGDGLPDTLDDCPNQWGQVNSTTDPGGQFTGCPPSSCANGIQDAYETGVDCGGACSAECAPVDPDYCFNGIRDPEESGVDCGGSCSTECSEVCPPGYEWLEDNCQGDGESRCMWIYSKDLYGNCQPGSASADDICRVGIEAQGLDPADYSSVCVAIADPVWEASSDPDPGDPPAPSPDNPAGSATDPDQITDPPTSPGQATETTTTDVSESDNGDGTVTRVTNITINKSATDGSGTESTTITRTEIIDGSGNVISSTETRDTTLPPEENIENYDYSIGDADYQGYSSSDAPGEDSISGLLDGWASSNPVSDHIKQTKILTVNEAACFNYVYKGNPVEFCFNKPFMTDFYLVFKGILISLASIFGIFIIFRR